MDLRDAIRFFAEWKLLDNVRKFWYKSVRQFRERGCILRDFVGFGHLRFAKNWGDMYD